jgi:hypothetical protein
MYETPTVDKIIAQVGNGSKGHCVGCSKKLAARIKDAFKWFKLIGKWKNQAAPL